MGLSFKDFDPTYSKGAVGGIVQGSIDYIINPFVAFTGDAIEYTFEKIAEYLVPDVDYQDRTLNTQGPTTARRVIYGKAKVGGQVAFIESTGTDSKVLHMVLIVADHHCQSIGDVYIGDKLSTDSLYDGKLSVYKSFDGTIPPELTSYLTSKGHTSYKYSGLSFLYCVFTYNEDVYRGIPQVSCVVEGKKDVYDPRTMTTGYTTNAALCQLDWIRNYIGAPDSEIDINNWGESADICDELVAAANGTTEPRFTLNGTIVQQGSKIEALGKLSANSGVIPVHSLTSGVWRSITETYTAPAETAIIDESYALSEISIKTGNDKQDKVNTIKGTYIDANREFEKIEYPSIQTPTFLDEDKEELEKTIDYQLVNSGTQCRRLAKIALEKSRRGVVVSASFRFRVAEYEVGDRVKFNLSALGWSEKIFQVIQREIDPIAGVKLVLREDSPDIYSWEEGDALESVVPPLLSLPDPTQIDPPSAFSVSEELYVANTQKAIKTRGIFTWTQDDPTTRHYEIQGSYEGASYRVLSDFITGSSFKFDDLQVGEWQFRIRGVNSIGAKSTWVDLSYTSLGKTAPPSDVTNFVGNIKPYSIELVWDSVPDLDVAEYEIRLGTDWASSTLLQRISALKWIWETRPTGEENVLIKAIDTTGNYSNNAAQASITIQQPSTCAPITAQVVDNNVELRWTNATTSFAIERYEIRRGENFDGATVLGDTKSTFKTTFEVEANTYRYWVRAVDVQGNTGPESYVDAIVDQPPDFVLQSDALLTLTDGTAVNMAEEETNGITVDSGDITADSGDITADAGGNIAFVGPLNLTETWNDHFVALGGTGTESIQALQIDAGYPIYAQPTPASASLEIVKDFLGTLSISRIQITPDVEILAGSPSIQWTVSYSSDGISYTDTIGTEATGKNFRYVKVRADITSASGLDLLRINSIRLRLDVKLKTDAGRVTVSGTGTANVLFNVAFVDIQSIQVSTNSTTNDVVTYGFADVPNPTNFDVYLFDSSGNPKAGEVSWNVRGV